MDNQSAPKKDFVFLNKKNSKAIKPKKDRGMYLDV
jgi:hypothetical protein